MAPLKYEDKMREKLEERFMQPSPKSWDKLSARLDDSEKRNSKKGFYWLVGIAASIIGVLWISSTLFSTDNIVPVETQIVDTPNIELIQEQQQDEIIEASEELIVDVESKTQKKIKPRIVEKPIKIHPNHLSTKEEVVENKITEFVEKKDVDINTDIINLDTVKNENVDVVVAQLTELKVDNSETSDVEIERLLNTAHDKIRLKKLYNNNSKTVDAITLLQDVEEDLDGSFKKKAFEVLKLNYDNLKTAIAQRND